MENSSNNNQSSWIVPIIVAIIAAISAITVAIIDKSSVFDKPPETLEDPTVEPPGTPEDLKPPNREIYIRPETQRTPIKTELQETQKTPQPSVKLIR